MATDLTNAFSEGRRGFPAHVATERRMREKLAQLRALPGFDPNETRETVPVMVNGKRRKVRREDLFGLSVGWIHPVGAKGRPMRRSVPFERITEILPERHARKAAEKPAETQAEPATPATLAPTPEIASSGAEIEEFGQSEPDGDPLSAVLERLVALEANLATLSAVSTDTPTGVDSGNEAPNMSPVMRAKRTPAHERAVRRAWAERKARHDAERVLTVAASNQAASNGQIMRLRTDLAEAERVAGERLQRIAHESERRAVNARRARRMIAAERAKTAALQRKRRRNALLARQRTREMVAAVNAMHDQADQLRAELDMAKRSPTYFDAETGLEKFDLAGQQAHFAKVAREEAERAQHALAAMTARCERVEEARDKLAEVVDGMASRLAVAEAAVRRLKAA